MCCGDNFISTGWVCRPGNQLAELTTDSFTKFLSKTKALWKSYISCITLKAVWKLIVIVAINTQKQNSLFSINFREAISDCNSWPQKVLTLGSSYIRQSNKNKMPGNLEVTLKPHDPLFNLTSYRAMVYPIV